VSLLRWNHVHFHVAALGGVYAVEEKKLRFVHVPTPTREERLRWGVSDFYPMAISRAA